MDQRSVGQGAFLGGLLLLLAFPARDPAPPGGPLAEPPPASVDGFVLLDPGVPREGIDVVLSFGRRSGEHATYIDREGRFSFDGLSTGRARLELRPKGAQILEAVERPLFFEAELVLSAGECADPRLACIDLRGKAFAHRIDLTGLDPRSDFHARAFFEPAGWRLKRRLYDHAWDLPLVVVSPWRAIDVELYAPGYRAVSLRGLGARAEVELRPGLPVKLRLRAEGALPQPPRHLKAVLVPTDDPDVAFDWEGPAFDATREVHTRAWKPGLHKVVWMAAEFAPDGRSAGGRVLCDVQPTQHVVVLDSPLEQAFDVALSPEAFASVLRAFE